MFSRGALLLRKGAIIPANSMVDSDLKVAPEKSVIEYI